MITLRVSCFLAIIASMYCQSASAQAPADRTIPSTPVKAIRAETPEPKLKFSEIVQKADAGDTAAMVEAGRILEEESSTPDYSEAIKWYEKAAALGNENAICTLADRYNLGFGSTPPDKSRARSLFQQISTFSHQECRLLFASCLVSGCEGIEKNPPAAPAILQKLIDEFSKPMAYAILGRQYLEGNGVQADCEKALQMIQKAADLGVAKSHYRLGSMYQEGKCVTKDLVKAKEMFAIAERSGLQEAREALTRMQ